MGCLDSVAGGLSSPTASSPVTSAFSAIGASLSLPLAPLSKQELYKYRMTETPRRCPVSRCLTSYNGRHLLHKGFRFVVVSLPKENAPSLIEKAVLNPFDYPQSVIGTLTQTK